MEQARVRRRRKEARPGEIVEAGFAEFALHGFERARIEDVAARAGIAKGTVYRYFPTKEALFLAVVRSRLGPPLGALEGALEGPQGTTRELLGALIGRLHAEVAKGEVPQLLRIILAEGARHPELARAYHAQVLGPGRALLARVLARGVARGEVRDGPAARMPLVLVAPVLMAALWRAAFEGVEPLDGEGLAAAHLALLDGLLL